MTRDEVPELKWRPPAGSADRRLVALHRRLVARERGHQVAAGLHAEVRLGDREQADDVEAVAAGGDRIQLGVGERGEGFLGHRVSPGCWGWKAGRQPMEAWLLCT